MARICLYLAGNWAKSYWTYRIAEYFTLLSSLARDEPLVSLQAPSSSIEVILRRTPASGEWFIHLLNYTGEMERPIKRIISLADIQIHLRAKSAPFQVDALRAGERLNFYRDGAYVIIPLNRLVHHEVIRVRW